MAEEAASGLRKAMKGLGTDEKRIIKILGPTSSDERQEIKQQYMTMYGHTLLEDLESEVSGDFLKTLEALLKPTVEYEAELVKKAMKGVGTDEKLLIELLLTKNGTEVKNLSETFSNMFGKNLDEKVASEQGGDFGRVLRSVASGNRDDSDEVDQELAEKEAQELYDAGEGTFGTDEVEFVRIICSRNFSQLNATFDAYEGIADNSIEKAIKKEMGGDLKKAFKAIVKSVRNRPKYFAELLHDAMDGMGTKEDDLTRIIVTRSDIDLGQIEEEYQSMYGKSLSDVVKSETRGDYEKLLLKLIERN